MLMLVMTYSASAFAADIPTVEAGAQEFDEQMCVEQYANDCINTICLTSERRDCQAQCRKEAVDKCRAQNQ